MMIVLAESEYDIEIGVLEDENYDFVIAVASGQKNLDEITEWIETHLVG